MFNPTEIVVHCSATRPFSSYSVEALRKTHVQKNGWSDIGYHYYITTDGELHKCRPLSRAGAHVKGHNSYTIGICMEGGLNNDNGKPDNNFNSNQFKTLRSIIEHLRSQFNIPHDKVCGHRDKFGDVNGDGVIDSRDWLKECPCFDVRSWYAGG